MSKIEKIPKLRFPEFSGEWEEKKLEHIFSILSGYSFSSNDATTEGVKLVKIADVGFQKMKTTAVSYLPLSFKNTHSKFLLNKGDYVLALTRPILGNNLKIAQIDDFFHQSLLNQRVGKLISSNNMLTFIYYLLQTSSLISKIQIGIMGTEPPNLSLNNIKSLKAIIPFKSEQQKIASFLTAVDKKIEQLTQKEELLQEYKKGVLQKIFSQEIRLKDESGNSYPDWQKRKLNQLLSESKERNFEKKFNKNDVLSVSGTHGIVNQIEFQGRSFAGASVDNYHIVEIGDIVYTKSPLKSNPYGIIKVNKYKAGIVSTLYAVYRPKESLNSIYLDYYFQLDDNTNKYLRPLVHKGAKNDMKINNSHVLSGIITIPSKQEQDKIVSFLVVLDEKIDQVSKELSQAKQFKKALLQQMFV